jgi:hypothetical protein
MRKSFLLFLTAIFLVSCSPSPEKVQEAIQSTMSGWTPVPTQTPYPTYTPQPTIAIEVTKIVLVQNTIPEPPVWSGGWTHLEVDSKQYQSFNLTCEKPVAIEVSVYPRGPEAGQSGPLIFELLTEDFNSIVQESRILPSDFEGWVRFDLTESSLTNNLNKTLFIHLTSPDQSFFGWKYEGDYYPDGVKWVSGIIDDGDWDFRLLCEY